MLLAFLALGSSCTPVPRVPFSGQYSGANETAYRLGYQKGFADGDVGRNEEYERHHTRYSVATEDAFKRGYELGYESGQDQADASEADREHARKEGYDAGRTDAENGSSPLYQRHRRNYRQKTEASFREGYARGFNSVRHHDPVD
jgi:hypothetical protein